MEAATFVAEHGRSMGMQGLFSGRAVTVAGPCQVRPMSDGGPCQVAAHLAGLASH